MYNLAWVYSALKMNKKAMRLYEQSLTVANKYLPEKDALIANMMHDLADTAICLGKHKQALNLFEQLLAHYKRILPPGDPKIDNTARCIEKIQSNEVHKIKVFEWWRTQNRFDHTIQYPVSESFIDLLQQNIYFFWENHSLIFPH